MYVFIIYLLCELFYYNNLVIVMLFMIYSFIVILFY